MNMAYLNGVLESIVEVIEKWPEWVLPSVIGVVVGWAVRTGIHLFKKIRKKRKINKMKNRYLRGQIKILDSAFPHYFERYMDLRLGDEEFYIEIPQPQIDELRKIQGEFVSRSDHLFHHVKDFDELGNNNHVTNLGALIEKHRHIVADSFVEMARRGSTIYNNKKLGIRYMSVSRSRDREFNTLHMVFYTTDYFTHKVMRSVFEELRNTGRVPEINYTSDLNQYYPFLTSFGMNSLLRVVNNENQYIALVKRSKETSNMVNEQWHVSMNEGLNMDDIDGKNINLNKWVKRGFREELNNEKRIANILFYSLFINQQSFEIGIYSLVETVDSIDGFLQNANRAKDFSIENLSIELVPDDYSEIRMFIEKHKDLTDACRYCLLEYLSRFDDVCNL